SAVTDKAKDIAGSVSQGVSSAVSNLPSASELADTAGSSVASGMKNLAGTLRETAGQGGMLGSAAASVADTLESGSRYLQDEGFAGLADDVTAVVRRNPIPAMLVCVGIGFLLGRTLSSSRS